MVSINFKEQYLARSVGLLHCHIKKTKKLSLKSKYKYIKNTMETGIV